MGSKNTQIRFLDNSLLINNEILVISDFHIGYEEYLFGKLIPIRAQYDEIIKNLNGIFDLLDREGVKIKEIIILGDLKHEFGEISNSEWRETLSLIDYFLKKTKKIILIRGNHDNILGPIAKKREIELKDYYKIGDICFLHGDKMNDLCKESKIFVIGHLHSAVTLNDSYKKEKFKCFLSGKWEGKQVIVMPSFIPLVFGYDLKNLDGLENGFSIIPNKELKNFDVIIYNQKENREYNFGKLKKLVK
jgi:uncharacterized protein